MAHRIAGTITGADERGNLISSITPEQLAGAPTDESAVIEADGHQTLGIFPVDHDQPEMTLIATVGPSGHLELSIVGDSAKIMLGIPVGAEITVSW